MLDRYKCYRKAVATERPDLTLSSSYALETGSSDAIAAGTQIKGMHDKFIVDPVGVQATMAKWLPQIACANRDQFLAYGRKIL